MKKPRIENKPKLIPEISDNLWQELNASWEHMWHSTLCDRFHKMAYKAENQGLLGKLPKAGFDASDPSYDTEIRELMVRFPELRYRQQSTLLYELTRYQKRDPELVKDFPKLWEAAKAACVHPLLEIMREGFRGYVELFRQQSNISQRLKYASADGREQLESEKSQLDEALAYHTVIAVCNSVRNYLGDAVLDPYKIAKSITGNVIHETILISQRLSIPITPSVPRRLL